MPGFTRGSVPVTWRLLTDRPVRLAVGALGVGLALMLILLLDGLWVGVQNRVTLFEDHTGAFEDHTGAQLAVVAPGTDSLFADASSLPIPQRRSPPGGIPRRQGTQIHQS